MNNYKKYADYFIDTIFKYLKDNNVNFNETVIRLHLKPHYELIQEKSISDEDAKDIADRFILDIENYYYYRKTQEEYNMIKNYIIDLYSIFIDVSNVKELISNMVKLPYDKFIIEYNKLKEGK